MHTTDNYLLEQHLDVADNWKALIEEIGTELDKITTSTEGEFLEIGANLQNYYFESSDISKLSSQAAKLMSGKEVEGAIEELGSLLDKLNEHMSRSEDVTRRYTDQLNIFLRLLSEVNKLIIKFKRIVNFLSILGVSTRIESSHLGSKDSGFKTLAWDIKKLAKLIQSKSTSIEEHSETMNFLIQKTLSRLLELGERQKSQAHEILTNARKSIESLTHFHDKSSRAAKSISKKSEKITENIGEIVTSSQFHDITRQQIEHVKEAFDGLENKLVSNQGKTGKGSDDEWEKMICSAGDLSELQKAQILHSKYEFINAVDNIINNLKGISLNVAAMSNEITRFSGSTNEAGSSFLDEIDDGVASIISMLSENAQAGRNLSDAVSSVAQRVGELSDFVNDIDEISSEIELIALNARIKAAHTGEKGAALGVLAESMQKLSLEAHSRTLSVSDSLTQISSVARELNEYIDREITEKDGHIDDIVNNLNSLLESLRKLNEKIFSILGKVEGTAKTLSRNIEGSASEINVHNEVDQVIDEVAGKIDRIIESSLELYPESKYRNDSILDDLQLRYTMESERKIHQSVSVPGVMNKPGASAAEDDNQILLFDDFGDEADSDLFPDNGDDGLELFDMPGGEDDNVDLFDSTFGHDDGVELFDSSLADDDDGATLFDDPGEDKEKTSEDNLKPGDDDITLFDDEDFGDNVDLF